MSDTGDELGAQALAYHEAGRPGKLEVRVTKPMATSRDLSLAYSPGVAAACLAIRDDPTAAARFTGRQNLVAVVSNGTAVLGLGDIGPLASKPVMEGKAALFKKFAGIDCYDIEVAETDPAKLAAIVAALEPTFGAVNLEDISAPACFEVERLCRETMGIPVFHDDQHGTAIVVAAAVTNALRLGEKRFEDLRVVSTGGGAAGIACLDLLRHLGVRRENIILYDRDGLVHLQRPLDGRKPDYALPGPGPTLAEAMVGADLFLGLSGPGVLKPEMVAAMAPNPIILALANPNPEIMPEIARAARPDAMIATGRSDYPNQVNNVLCFPFIFRGALDCGATEINEAMKIACATAIADLAHAPGTEEAARVYAGERLVFGRDYLIPKPFDPRLLATVAAAVAEAAMESGVATRPITDMPAYRERLERTVYRSGFLMKPIFERARQVRRRVVFAEGEDERALRTALAMAQEGVDRPVLIGRRRVLAANIEKLGLPLEVGRDFEPCDPEDDPRYGDYWRDYYNLTRREGVTPDLARAIMRTNTTAIGAVMVHRGEADSVICGLFGQYLWHLNYIRTVLCRDGKRRPIGALVAMILDSGPIFIADTQVHAEPTPAQLVEIARAAASELGLFGITPKVAFISASNFGNLRDAASERAQSAVRLLDAEGADFDYEGEMHVDVAVDPALRERIFPNSRLEGAANLLIMPSMDAATAAKNVLKSLAGGLQVGPILMGMQGAAHIVTPTMSARGLLNVAALAGGGEFGGADLADQA
ncbi:NADP-dependent malic enzyme [Rubrimonas cliftonensis]|uniref:Malate dehydrogenase (Oxaloacetate-decarboxylating)(NADP+) n=1 Tax=Rubrimonas cliftonensis TaxID=89524 RepID=A0A1H3WZH0_9RHOB|nr:NADP-dependent malic enzyme [Rubrimonas cliftonensis]SDZ92383.1 malate dehydrogenase (oxaloacetate-decarboxylating)(NADP+) [Rubrimonas cliftonensis]